MELISQTPPAVPEDGKELARYVEKQLTDHYEDIRNLINDPSAVNTNDKVAVDSGATAGYLGALPSDGVLRVASDLTYADGGDFVTIGINKTQDYTWTGAHQFDASVDVFGALDCSVVSCKQLLCEQSLDASDAAFAGDVSVAGVIKVDGTATQFGGTLGLGLFYDPTVETAAAESIGVTSINNGFKIAYGTVSVSANSELTVSPTGFTAVYSATIVEVDDTVTDRDNNPKLGNYAGASFTIRNTRTTTMIISYIAVGR